jgi:hypothetical protein
LDTTSEMTDRWAHHAPNWANINPPYFFFETIKSKPNKSTVTLVSKVPVEI